MQALQLPGLALNPLKLGTTRFDLEFHLWERWRQLAYGGAIRGTQRLCGIQHRFDQATIARMVGHFQTLLERLSPIPTSDNFFTALNNR